MGRGESCGTVGFQIKPIGGKLFIYDKTYYIALQSLLVISIDALSRHGIDSFFENGMSFDEKIKRSHQLILSEINKKNPKLTLDFDDELYWIDEMFKIHFFEMNLNIIQRIKRHVR